MIRLLIPVLLILALFPAPVRAGANLTAPPPGERARLEKILEANLAAQNENHTLPPLPSEEEMAPLLKPVNEFYFRLWTLDPKFPDLFTDDVRELQARAMESFAAHLMQKGTFESFTKSYVDVSNLHHYLLDRTEDTAVVKTSGFLTIIISGFEEDWAEDNTFHLVREDGTWKIRDIDEGGPGYR